MIHRRVSGSHRLGHPPALLNTQQYLQGLEPLESLLALVNLFKIIIPSQNTQQLLESSLTEEAKLVYFTSLLSHT